MPKNTGDNGRDNAGKFAKGNQGKPKGAQAKTTKAMKEFVVEFLNEKSPELYSMWDELDSRDKVALLLNLTRMVLPRPQVEVESHVNKEPLTIVVRSMSEVD